MALKGDLQDFSLKDILELLNKEKKTGILNVSFAEEGIKSEILLYFQQGNIVSAVLGEISGVAVIDKLASVSRGQFEFLPKENLQLKHLLQLNFNDVLKRYKESANKWQPLKKLFPSLTTKIMLSEKGNDKIEFSKSEWKIITSIGNGVTIENIINTLHIGELELLVLLKNLKEKAVIEVSKSEDTENYENVDDIIPVAMVWFRGKSIKDKIAEKLYKKIDNKKTLSQIAKELGINVREAKKALNYLVSIGKAGTKRK